MLCHSLRNIPYDSLRTVLYPRGASFASGCKFLCSNWYAIVATLVKLIVIFLLAYMKICFPKKALASSNISRPHTNAVSLVLRSLSPF